VIPKFFRRFPLGYRRSIVGSHDPQEQCVGIQVGETFDSIYCEGGSVALEFNIFDHESRDVFTDDSGHFQTGFSGSSRGRFVMRNHGTGDPEDLFYAGMSEGRKGDVHMTLMNGIKDTPKEGQC
jgi:hypothetical protein